MLHHIYFFNSATMQFFLSLMLVISFATFQLAFGDEKKVDSLTDDSKQDHEVANQIPDIIENSMKDYKWLCSFSNICISSGDISVKYAN